MQRIYESEISRMQDMIDHSTNAREVGQATKRRDKLIKQLKECREYDEKLAHLALSRIELDLDDGVKVNYRKLQTANDGKFYEVLGASAQAGEGFNHDGISRVHMGKQFGQFRTIPLGTAHLFCVEPVYAVLIQHIDLTG